MKWNLLSETYQPAPPLVGPPVPKLFARLKRRRKPLPRQFALSEPEMRHAADVPFAQFSRWMGQ